MRAVPEAIQAGSGLVGALAAAEAAAADLIAGGRAKEAPARQLATALAALLRLSVASRGEAGAAELPVERDALTATETVTIVSGLLRAADLNVFDLAMWFRRAP